VAHQAWAKRTSLIGWDDERPAQAHAQNRNTGWLGSLGAVLIPSILFFSYINATDAQRDPLACTFDTKFNQGLQPVKSSIQA
jgi:hypothetical protein